MAFGDACEESIRVGELEVGWVGGLMESVAVVDAAAAARWSIESTAPSSLLAVTGG
jgi:L-alanine-DL-glutamate epimerase-like enolase superfamily enzyme